MERILSSSLPRTPRPLVDEKCLNPECTHDEPNLAYVCPVCKREYDLIVRKLSTVPPGSVIAYDPFCGVTVYS